MTSNNPLPAHLERIGDHLIAAAESLYATDRGRSRRHALPRRAFATLVRAPRLAIASGIASLAAMACVVVVFATAGTPPAYALTQNANGTYTITINDIATGVPALNVKLKQLGIDATAVPVTATCSAPIQIGGPGALTERTEETLSPANITSGSEGLLNLTPANIPSGSEGVIAAYQSPSRQINLTFWTTSGSPPSCLNTRGVVTPSPAPDNQP
jgi:hypothetical protein